MKNTLWILIMAAAVGAQGPDLPDPSDRAAVRKALIFYSIADLALDSASVGVSGDSVTFRGKTLSVESFHYRMIDGAYGDEIKKEYIYKVKSNLTSMFDLIYLSWKIKCKLGGPKMKECMRWLDVTGGDLGLDDIRDVKKSARETVKDIGKPATTTGSPLRIF